MTAAYVLWPMMYVLHIGDSRCYLLRDGKLSLLTKDQTFAQHLYDTGHLTDEEFAMSNYHNVLLSAIGCDGMPDAVVYRQELKHDDRLLLCSDGVNLHLEDQEIESILSQGCSSQETCHRLVDRANEEGGRDNITAVVANFKKPSPQVTCQNFPVLESRYFKC